MIKTITIDSGRFINFISASMVYDALKNTGSGIRYLSVTRPFFSERYIIVIETNFNDTNIYNMILDEFHSIGMDEAWIVKIEDGGQSSSSGGIQGIVNTGENIGKNIKDTVDKSLPIIGIAIVGGILLIYMIERRK